MVVSAFLPPLLGGVLIGLAAALLLWLNGRVVGVSGMLGGVIAPVRGDALWRAFALLGLVLAGWIGSIVAPEQLQSSPRSLPLLAVAGLCIGIGTRLGNGCTSGHGVCGMGRMSVRSFVAAATFVVCGVITVTLLRVLEVAP